MALSRSVSEVQVPVYNDLSIQIDQEAQPFEEALAADLVG
jgi:hypothetical protein